MRPLRRFVRGVKPSVSTKPGKSVCTWIPPGRSVAASERENASCACFEPAYGPAGANAIVPATETTFTMWASPPAAALEPGRERARAPDAAEVVRLESRALIVSGDVETNVPRPGCPRC